jgi:hypothetical protein
MVSCLRLRVLAGERVGDALADPFGEGDAVGFGAEPDLFEHVEGEPDGEGVGQRLAADDPVSVDSSVGAVGVEVSGFLVAPMSVRHRVRPGRVVGCQLGGWTRLAMSRSTDTGQSMLTFGPSA